MTKPRKRPARLLADRVAAIADIATSPPLDRETYFEVIDRGIYEWLRKEEQTPSKPDRSEGLTGPQRRVLEIALRRIAHAARKRRRLCVFALATSVQQLMEQKKLGRTEPKDIFYGWKMRLAKEPYQPVLTRTGEYLMFLTIDVKGDNRREIRAHVAVARPKDDRWTLAIAIDPVPNVKEEIESISSPELPTGADPVISAVATATYVVLQERQKKQAERFLQWCEDEKIPIRMWFRGERRRLRGIETAQIIEVSAGLMGAGTSGALALASTVIGGGKTSARGGEDCTRSTEHAAANMSTEVLGQIARTPLPEIDRKVPKD